MLRAGICDVAESNLRKKELKVARIPGHGVIASFCRIAEGRRVGGGVLTPEATAPTEDTIVSGEGVGESAGTCAAYIPPVGGEAPRLRITGVYIPPPRTRQPTREHLHEVTPERGDPRRAKGRTTLAIGDFNPAAWTELFEGRPCEVGMWQLSDPRNLSRAGEGELVRAL